MAAKDSQVGGDHYVKRSIQPWDIFEAYPDMSPFIAHVIPYLLRWRDKNGVEDLKKARHNLDRLIEIEEAKQEQHPAATEPPDIMERGRASIKRDDLVTRDYVEGYIHKDECAKAGPGKCSCI